MKIDPHQLVRAQHAIEMAKDVLDRTYKTGTPQAQARAAAAEVAATTQDDSGLQAWAAMDVQSEFWEALLDEALGILEDVLTPAKPKRRSISERAQELLAHRETLRAKLKTEPTQQQLADAMGVSRGRIPQLLRQIKDVEENVAGGQAK